MLRESFNNNDGEGALLRNAADQDRHEMRSFDNFLKAAKNIPGVEHLSITPMQPTTPRLQRQPTGFRAMTND